MDPINELKIRLKQIKDLAGVEAFNRDVYKYTGWRKNLDKLCADVDWKKPPSGLGPLQHAVALWKLGRRRQAITVISRRKTAEVEGVLLSRFLLKSGTPRAALETLVPLLKTKARSSWVKTTLLEAMRKVGDKEGWAKKLRSWENDLKSRPDFLHEKGRFCEEQGDYRGAKKAYETALEIDGLHRGSLFRLALLEGRLGSQTKAISLYEEIRELRPTNVNALVNLAVLYEDEGHYDKAQRVLREVLADIPTHERARMFLRDVVGSKDMFYDEDLERKNDKRLQVLRTPVTDFELSVRSRNCLKQMDIDSLGDLVTKTEQELLAHKNFGETSLAEIKQMLAQRNLRLGMLKKGDEIPGFTDPRSGRARELLARPITELELSVRARRCMEKMNVTTIGQLCSMSDQELLAVRNFGQTSLVEIRTKLGELGMKLKGDP